jgi:hypothetical protein
MRVTNGIHLGCSLLLPAGTVNCVQTWKERAASKTFGEWVSAVEYKGLAATGVTYDDQKDAAYIEYTFDDPVRTTGISFQTYVVSPRPPPNDKTVTVRAMT